MLTLLVLFLVALLVDDPTEFLAVAFGWVIFCLCVFGRLP